MPDAAFPSRKAASDETQSTQNIGNSPHHYRITIDTLDPLKPGEGGLESVSFFAATQSDLFAEASQLRDRLGCSAAQATKLAVGLSLIGERKALPEMAE
jgi:hypothetical protein